MSGRRFPLVLALAAAVACAGPYAERPPASGETGRRTNEQTPAEPDAAGSPDSTGTVIGQVTPDGRLHADTLAEAPPPEPVERETVVTGQLRAPGAAAEPAPEPGRGAPPAEAVEVPPSPGWRIQVFAARDEATAAQVARRAGDAVPGVPVYVEAEASWFKVRLGDFADREAAERMRQRLVGLGWADAWAVRTAIRSPR